MKRIWPARMRAYSGSSGSLTFMIMSQAAQVSSQEAMVAPAAT